MRGFFLSSCGFGAYPQTVPRARKRPLESLGRAKERPLVRLLQYRTPDSMSSTSRHLPVERSMMEWGIASEEQHAVG